MSGAALALIAKYLWHLVELVQANARTERVDFKPLTRVAVNPRAKGANVRIPTTQRSTFLNVRALWYFNVNEGNRISV